MTQATVAVIENGLARRLGTGHPCRIKGEEMQDQHSGGEVSEVNQQHQSKVERYHGQPHPRAESSKQSQWSETQFKSQGRPGADLQEPRGQAEQQGTEKRIARQWVGEHAAQGAAIDPGWTDELRVTAVCIG